jgi:hypothetical protein
VGRFCFLLFAFCSCGSGCGLACRCVLGDCVKFVCSRSLKEEEAEKEIKEFLVS